MREKLRHKRSRDEIEQARRAPARHDACGSPVSPCGGQVTHDEAAAVAPHRGRATPPAAAAPAAPAVVWPSEKEVLECAAFILRAAHKSKKVAAMKALRVDLRIYDALVACGDGYLTTRQGTRERMKWKRKKDELTGSNEDQFESSWTFVTKLLPMFRKATKEELGYVVGSVMKPDWKTIAQRLLHMCAFWANDARPVMSDKALFPAMEDTPRYATLFEKLVDDLILCADACDKSKVERTLESLEVRHVLNGKSYYGLAFVATRDEAHSLLKRDVESKHLGVVNLKKIINSSLSDLIGTVAFTGETGSAKTSTALRCACGDIPTSRSGAGGAGASVAIYATAVNLQLDKLEHQLEALHDEACQQRVTDHIVSQLKRKFPVQAESSRVVAILVIDELGACPRAARALCQITEHADLANALKIGQVVVFAVGTGVDHALSKSASKPDTYKHVRTQAFGAVHGAYEASSGLWKAVAGSFDSDELPHGVFAKMLRLSRNARVAALLHQFESSAIPLIGSFDLYALATRRPILRDVCLRVATSALWELRSYNGLANHTAAQALTEFGAAFAAACGNVHQKIDRDACLRFGLITDQASRVATAALADGDVVVERDAAFPTVVKEGVQHRFHMSAAAVEVGTTSFGLTMPRAGWEGFEEMLTSLLALHMFSAMCATALRMTLGDLPAEPLRELKLWAREHGSRAHIVVEVTLDNIVSNQADAKKKLITIAMGVFDGERCDATVCAVVVRNAPKAPFADAFAGVVTRTLVQHEDEHWWTYAISSWLVLQAKHQSFRSSAGAQCPAPPSSDEELASKLASVIATHKCEETITSMKIEFNKCARFLKEPTARKVQDVTLWGPAAHSRCSMKLDRLDLIRNTVPSIPLCPAPADAPLMFIVTYQQDLSIQKELKVKQTVTERATGGRQSATATPARASQVTPVPPTAGSATPTAAAGAHMNSHLEAHRLVSPFDAAGALPRRYHAVITPATQSMAFYPTHWGDEQYTAYTVTPRRAFVFNVLDECTIERPRTTAEV